MSQYYVTQDDIRSGLNRLQVGAGDVILVHVSLSAFGHVIGGAQAVVGALLEAVGKTGTVVVATHTPENSDPRDFRLPPLPPRVCALWERHYPAFDAALTPCSYMGGVAELVRALPGAVRSAHPLFSFAAVGQRASELLRDHELEDGLGEGSPLARIYDAGGKVVLLGTGHDANTSLHLAEARADASARRLQQAALMVDGCREWLSYNDRDWDSGPFLKIGAAFEDEHPFCEATAGAARMRSYDQRSLVDFGVAWYRRAPRWRSEEARPPRQLALGQLRMRAPTLDDAPALRDYAVRPVIDGCRARSMGSSLEGKQSEICAAIHGWELAREFTWVIERLTDSLVVGVLCAVPQASRFRLSWDIRDVEPAVAGLLRDVFAALFAHCPDVSRLEYLCSPSDARDIQLAQDTGLTREGLLTSYALGPTGQSENRLIFGCGRAKTERTGEPVDATR